MGFKVLGLGFRVFRIEVCGLSGFGVGKGRELQEKGVKLRSSKGCAEVADLLLGLAVHLCLLPVGSRAPACRGLVFALKGRFSSRSTMPPANLAVR